jgi:acetyltransferase-like isoleucine patch superfamily enzyme
MSLAGGLLYQIRRGEGPVFSRLKWLAKAVVTFSIHVPRWLRPPLAFLYFLHFGIRESIRKVVSLLYFSPLFQGRCEQVGKRLRLEQLPELADNVRIYLGDDVTISGMLSIASGRLLPNPRLVVGNRVFMGHPIVFSIQKEVVIEDDVLIAAGCYITDNINHPKDADARAAGAPVDLADVRPVRICSKAWIGRDAKILPGVTVGAGAIVGAGAVVSKDVPPGRVCVGNPGRILETRVDKNEEGNS